MSCGVVDFLGYVMFFLVLVGGVGLDYVKFLVGSSCFY